MVALAAIALCCLFPGAASGGVINADTNLGGSCQLVSSFSRGATINYSVQVASSTCQVPTGIRHIVSVGFLYNVDTHEQADLAPAVGTPLPYSNSSTYMFGLMDAMDDFQSRWDISVLLRCPQRPAPGPPGSGRNCGRGGRERWIDPDPGNRCRVATKYRFRDRLVCRLQDSIPF